MDQKGMKLPKNDKELEELLESLGRNKEQIEGIKDFGKLVKAMNKDEKESDKIIKELNCKYE